MTALVLWVLGGCHVFEDGSINVTCDELPACQTTVDTAEDTGMPLPELSLGFGYAAVDEDSWTMTAHNGTLDVVFQRSGLGAFQGPFDYDPATGRGIVATADRLYVMGPDADSLTSHLMPTTLEPIDMARLSDGIILITEADIVFQETPAETPEIKAEGWLFEGRHIAVFTDGDDAYILNAGKDGRGDLFSYTKGEQLEFKAFSLVEDAQQDLGGGGFIGAEGAISFCSNDGEIRHLSDLIDGNQEPSLLIPTTDRVVRCAWDNEQQRYLALQEDGTLLVSASDGATSEQISLLRSDMTMNHGHFFAE